jgi:hypothetical protein
MTMTRRSKTAIVAERVGKALILERAKVRMGEEIIYHGGTAEKGGGSFCMVVSADVV